MLDKNRAPINQKKEEAGKGSKQTTERQDSKMADK
jgi:hypothetical protein